MKSYRTFVLCFFVALSSLSGQEDDGEQLGMLSTQIDSLYREDQFYFGVTYNLLNSQSESISESGFSGGVHFGFIRDFPLNKQRNVALGVGLGGSANSYGQNLFIGEDPLGETIFRSLREQTIPYDTNRFTTYLVESPLEFRWRTSTPESYKFWRVYTGLRLGYVFYFKSNFVQSNNTVKQTNVPELERLRLGTTFTFGYNTFNFHFYYSLNSFFKDASLYETGENIDLTTFKIGLMFYIL